MTTANFNLCQAHWSQLSALLSPAAKGDVPIGDMKAHLARLNGIILAEAETARFNPLTDPFATGISATYPCLQYLITERAFESLSELGCGQRMGPLRGWVIGLLTTILEVVPAQEILPMIRTSLSKVILTSHMYNPPRLLFDLDGDREIGDEEEEKGDEGAGAKKGTEEGTLLLTLVRLVADMVGERPPLSAYLFDGEYGFYLVDVSMARLMSTHGVERRLAVDALRECVSIATKHPRVMSHIIDKSRLPEHINDQLLELLAKAAVGVSVPGDATITLVSPPIRFLSQYPPFLRALQEAWHLLHDILTLTHKSILGQRIIRILQDGAFLFLSDGLANGKSAMEGNISSVGMIECVTFILDNTPTGEGGAGPLEKALMNRIILEARFCQQHLPRRIIEESAEMSTACLHLLLAILHRQDEQAMEVLLLRDIRQGYATTKESWDGDGVGSDGNHHKGDLDRALSILSSIPYHQASTPGEISRVYAERAHYRHQQACDARRAWLLADDWAFEDDPTPTASYPASPIHPHMNRLSMAAGSGCGVVGALIDLTTRLPEIPLSQSLPLVHIWTFIAVIADECVEHLLWRAAHQPPSPSPGPEVRTLTVVEALQAAGDRLAKLLPPNPVGMEERARQLCIPPTMEGGEGGHRLARRSMGHADGVTAGVGRRSSWMRMSAGESFLGKRSSVDGGGSEARAIRRWVLLREACREVSAGMQERSGKGGTPSVPTTAQGGVRRWMRPNPLEVLESFSCP